MAKTFRDLGEILFLLFNKSEYKINHPCVFTKGQSVAIHKEYLLLGKTLPPKIVVVKRIYLNINYIKLKLFSIPDNKSFWIIQSFDENYWYYDEWRLIDNNQVERNACLLQ